MFRGKTDDELLTAICVLLEEKGFLTARFDKDRFSCGVSYASRESVCAMAREFGVQYAVEQIAQDAYRLPSPRIREEMERQRLVMEARRRMSHG